MKKVFSYSSVARFGEQGFVLLTSMMMVVILSILVAGMVRESGSSKKASSFALRSVDNDQLAKTAQILCAEVAVRARNGLLGGIKNTSQLINVALGNQNALIQSLVVANDRFGSVIDTAFASGQPYFVIGNDVIYLDVDWQGGFDAGFSTMLAFAAGGCGGSTASFAGWDCFGNVAGTQGFEVGASGTLRNANAVSDNYQLYSCQIVVQDAQRDAAGRIVVPQKLDLSRPYRKLEGTYAYDFTRTIPADF